MTGRKRRESRETDPMIDGNEDEETRKERRVRRKVSSETGRMETKENRRHKGPMRVSSRIFRPSH